MESSCAQAQYMSLHRLVVSCFKQECTSGSLLRLSSAHSNIIALSSYMCIKHFIILIYISCIQLSVITSINDIASLWTSGLIAHLNLILFQAFLDFRCSVIERRARFKLSQALERKHIVEVKWFKRLASDIERSMVNLLLLAGHCCWSWQFRCCDSNNKGNIKSCCGNRSFSQGWDLSVLFWQVFLT